MSAAKTKQNISLNQLPPGKNIPGTAIVVDAFKYRNPDFLYFLSHFHQDHYGGITKNWSDGPIYCSQITARLLRHVLDVPEQYIKSLPQNEPVDLNAECRVTLMDANHCPGAHVLIFDVKTDESVKRYVHCGDMRYEARMKCWPSWFRDGALVDVETVFLDTTYCNPRYKFPKQDVVTAADDTPPLAQAQRRTLFVVATYTIGKEKVLHEISTACGDLCIYTSPDKKEILNLLDLPYANIFVREPRESSVHMITWGKLGEMVPGGWRFLPNWGFAQEYLDWANSLLSDDVPKFTHLAGIVPTGWTWEFQKQHGTGSLFHCTMKPGQEHLCIYEVPYSEHSNFEELREFVEFLKPARVVPTVVGKSGNAGKLAGYFRDLVDSRKSFQLGFNDLFAGEWTFNFS
ncbi:beta-lactamase-like protein [Fimicolochytrium jonesii]|uniref:beta-lactamase-like protein n=1 Tax=Fimicolochytrium jonesii TaxID=1396493 RepID=UPI0022FEE7D7|nr:beta-lactamase-like protein [Fimicolochytrium jonesii]KAI8822905.1 beta-lactamase-like protein [Fimicolochytrium jonesii]